MSMKINIGDSWKNVSATKIKLDTNLADYSNWINGETGSTTNWIAYLPNPTGTTIGRYNVATPFGNQDVAWVVSGKTNISGTVTGGGFNANFTDIYQDLDPISIDPSYDYRVSMWINRKIVSGGTLLVGCFFLNESESFLYYKSLNTSNVTGSTQQSPFYTSNVNSQFPQDTWKLITGYIHNSGYTGNNWLSGGTYTTGGTFTGSLTEVILVENVKSMMLRAYHIGCGPTAQTYFLYPRIDRLDGTEPSITTLLNNEGPWRTVNSIKVNVGDTWKTMT